MPESIEVETDKLQDQVMDAREAPAPERTPAWLRYLGLGTALLAVFAAIAALHSGDLINEALMNQLKASDRWNEYQAARQKEHLYTLAVDELTDRGSRNEARLRSYRDQIAKEVSKEGPLQQSARRLEQTSEAQVARHRSFEYAVALLQVGIALGAVAALARSKPAWYVSLAAGAAGLAFFLQGYLVR
jgi:hypothetical protein